MDYRRGFELYEEQRNNDGIEELRNNEGYRASPAHRLKKKNPRNWN